MVIPARTTSRTIPPCYLPKNSACTDVCSDSLAGEFCKKPSCLVQNAGRTAEDNTSYVKGAEGDGARIEDGDRAPARWASPSASRMNLNWPARGRKECLPGLLLHRSHLDTSQMRIENYYRDSLPSGSLFKPDPTVVSGERLEFLRHLSASHSHASLCLEVIQRSASPWQEVAAIIPRPPKRGRCRVTASRLDLLHTEWRRQGLRLASRPMARGKRAVCRSAYAVRGGAPHRLRLLIGQRSSRPSASA